MTCDNAGNNDTMIDELVDLLPNFPGAANRCRCFLHVVNLVAKTLLKQFDVLKKKASAAVDKAEQALLELVEGLDVEEIVTAAEIGFSDNEENDNIEGWADETTSLTEKEKEELRQSVQPVRFVLVKVCWSCQSWANTDANLHHPVSSESSRSKSCTHQRRFCPPGLHT
jgi:hypothetical protein